MLTYSRLPSVNAFSLTLEALHRISIQLYPRCRGPLDTPRVWTGASLRAYTIQRAAPTTTIYILEHVQPLHQLLLNRDALLRPWHHLEHFSPSLYPNSLLL